MNELTVSLHRQPGIYALLLGSGLSRSAKVPTGWEVTLDLIRRLAIADGGEPEDLEAWYREHYQEEPDYSRILEHIAPTEAERQGLIEAYFEPNEEERAQGLKLPTEAHRAIARLVAKGYIRVILTTNFDRLTEQALQDEGVQPTVIASTDAIKGAPPYVHAKVVIVKLHGDYKDTRIRNSLTELEKYDQELDVYLDRILDEFGLIVAGWSGDWDAALRGAILRMQNRRYPLYWLAYSDPSAAAQKLIRFRQGRVVGGMGADTFFGSLLAKVDALEEASWTPPQSVELLLVEVKRYLAEPDRYGIRLEDLVLDEARALAQIMRQDLAACPWVLQPSDSSACRTCLTHLTTKSERLTRILATIVRYDRQQAWAELVARAVDILAQEPRPQYLNDPGLYIRLYPLTLITTALFVVGAQEGRVMALRRVLDLEFRTINRKHPFMYALGMVEDQGRVFEAANGRTWCQPAAMHTANVLLPWLRNLLVHDRIYNVGEFLLSLALQEVGSRQGSAWWSPLGGRYMYEHGNDIETFLQQRPVWLSQLYPNIEEMLRVFDEKAPEIARGKGGGCIGRIPFNSSAAYRGEEDTSQ